jgi:hypothetical protein
MATSAASVPNIAFKLEALGNFGSTQTQSPKNGLPLYLASRGVQGKLSLNYNKFALPIQVRDVVKVTLNGMSNPDFHLFVVDVVGFSSIRVPWKGPGKVQRYTQLQSSVRTRSTLKSAMLIFTVLGSGKRVSGFG